MCLATGKTPAELDEYEFDELIEAHSDIQSVYYRRLEEFIGLLMTAFSEPKKFRQFFNQVLGREEGTVGHMMNYAELAHQIKAEKDRLKRKEAFIAQMKSEGKLNFG